MSPLILVVNAGSSSVKITLFSFLLQQDVPYNYQNPQAPVPVALAQATIARLSSPPAILSYSRGSKKIIAEEIHDVKNHTDAVGCILETLLADTGLEALAEKENITQVCHRIVHGGNYTTPHVIDWEAYQRIDQLAELAPL
jgi:acetate kinase